MRAPRRIIPNLPDIALRRMFQYLDYRELCKAECVCKRWQNIIMLLMRRNIHEITFEQFGATELSVRQVVPLRRLTVTCPAKELDFEAGVLRRYVRLHCTYRLLTKSNHLKNFGF
ncbi:unnamed protein product [Strongylus vulgaris]|uniref:F-box domain-containing protein n=1 Tax=Strongylus vulgaris TaxID=40348 RepID=A0A3P7LPV2_STRVU|nr:unnamed protein product [Strongylus vulgaris]